jgi:PIN domain nuclease of toxin-antitoxin system
MPIWLWGHTEPDRLSQRVAGALADDVNQLWLSPISIWEFLLITERGRVRVRGGVPPAEWVGAALSRAPMHDAPLTGRWRCAAGRCASITRIPLTGSWQRRQMSTS